MKKMTPKTLKSKISKLESELEELKKQQWRFEEGQRAVLIENKLKVDILKQLPKKQYCVVYSHLGNEQYRQFIVHESELMELPFNYDELIFSEYIKVHQELKYLKDLLRRGK